MKSVSKLSIPLKKDAFYLALFISVLFLPVNPFVQVLIILTTYGLVSRYITFKSTDSSPSTPSHSSTGLASPTLSQVNPFVATTTEMRIALEHDIQTPLTKIIAQTDALLYEAPHLAASLARIMESACYLSKHTASYFEFFGLQETSLEPDRLVDLGDILRNHLIEAIGDLEQNNVTYRFDIPDKPVYIETESNLLERAVGDLLSYLFQFIESFRDLRVTVIIRKLSIEVNLFIDTDDYTRQRLLEWQLFGHTDTSRNLKEGHNQLTIVLANQMILKHGGTLSVNQYASQTLHYQIKLKNPHKILL